MSKSSSSRASRKALDRSKKPYTDCPSLCIPAVLGKRRPAAAFTISASRLAGLMESCNTSRAMAGRKPCTNRAVRDDLHVGPTPRANTVEWMVGQPKMSPTATDELRELPAEAAGVLHAAVTATEPAPHER